MPASCDTGLQLSSVIKTQQLSGALCTQGSSWRFESRYILVSNGCRALFTATGASLSSTPVPEPALTGTSSSSGGTTPEAPTQSTSTAQIRCESQNYQPARCDTGLQVAGASLYQQLSAASCVKGSSWSYDSRYINVTNGCRAIFTATGTPASTPPPPTAPEPTPVPTEPTPTPSSPTAGALQPVVIKSGRFYSGSKPYFPTGNFLTSGAGFTHAYFSEKISDAQRLAMRSTTLQQGYNSIYIYLINQGDYGSLTVTPYAGCLIGCGFDDAKIARWRTELDKLIAAGIRPILWLFPDDSPSISSTGDSELKAYIAKMVAAFDSLPVMWVLGLEVDEYFAKSRSDYLGAYLQSLARNPVGVHQTPGRTDYMASAWVEFGVYQYGFGLDWTRIYSDTLTKKAALSGRPFIAGEYTLGDDAGGEVLGLAAAFAGAAGAGNAAPADLDEFMTTLPDGLIPSRSNSMLYLKNSGFTATANMATRQFYTEPSGY
jgi:hypothetical protein